MTNRSSEEQVWREVSAGRGRHLQEVLASLSGRRPAGAAGDDDGTPSLRRLFAVARPYRFWLAGGLGTVFLGSLVGLGTTLLWRYLVDAIVPGGEAEILGRVTLALIALYLLQSLFSLSSGYLLGVTGLRLTMHLRLMLYEHLQTLPLGFYAEKRTGELISRLMNDVTTVRGVMTGDLSGLLRQVVFFFGALILIIVTDWRLTVLMFLLVPVVSLVSIFLGRALRRLSAEVTDEYAAVNTQLEETISGVKTVRAFAREDYEVGRLRRGLGRLLTIALKRMYLEILFGPLLSALFFTSTVVIIWYGGQRVLEGALTTGQLVTFIILTSLIGGSIRWVGGLWTRLQSALGSSDRIFRLLDLESDLREDDDAVDPGELEGRVSFEGVSFAYPAVGDDEAPLVLRDVDLEISPGDTVAIVGPSGAGKTTLIHLVPRFYDPLAGRVSIDGVDVRRLRLAPLRRRIGFVAQEAQLFGGTVRENLLYGKLDASEDELIEAARSANAEEFIRRLPRGLDTVVGERGVKLSGGQRQRLTIARALLENPRVLLLDEATSALDSESERLVQEALDRLMEDRTTLVIAHRLSTVQNADRIVVLDQGRVAELGTHDELLAAGGLYASLYRQQFRDGKPESGGEVFAPKNAPRGSIHPP